MTDKFEEVKKLLQAVKIGECSVGRAAITIGNLFQEPELCPECKGRGRKYPITGSRYNVICFACNGTGKKEK